MCRANVCADRLVCDSCCLHTSYHDYADLNDLANADGDMDEHKDDPMSILDIEGYIVQQLRSLHNTDKAGFEGLCTALNATQLQTIKSMLS